MKFRLTFALNTTHPGTFALMKDTIENILRLAGITNWQWTTED